MPVRIFRDGRVTLPESVRAAFELLPGDPMLYQLQGRELVLTRVTPKRSASPARSRQPGRVLPWHRGKEEGAASPE